jgi:hypothetical protein
LLKVTKFMPKKEHCRLSIWAICYLNMCKKKKEPGTSKKTIINLQGIKDLALKTFFANRLPCH